MTLSAEIRAGSDRSPRKPRPQLSPVPPAHYGPLRSPGEVLGFDSPDVDEYNTFWNGNRVQLIRIWMTDNFGDSDDVQALLAQAPSIKEKPYKLARRCLRHPSRKHLQCFGTAATVRDIITFTDAFASANGLGSPVSFIGASYASLLGMWLIINVSEYFFDDFLTNGSLNVCQQCYLRYGKVRAVTLLHSRAPVNYSARGLSHCRRPHLPNAARY